MVSGGFRIWRETTSLNRRMKLAKKIESTRPKRGELAVFSLAQSGFLFKTSAGTKVCLDAYVSDSCERLFGFKRMVPAPIAAEELHADIALATHAHADHLDADLLACMKRKAGTRFVGAPDCAPVYRRAGIPKDRITILAAGEEAHFGDVAVRAVYADHGELAPDAVGFLITVDGVTVYDTGDTSYRPEKMLRSLGNVRVDILIAPINSAYGNLGHKNAVRLAARLRPRVLVGSHFGMFVEHGGDPGAFLAVAKRTLPETVFPLVMAPGERLMYSKKRGVLSLETQSCRRQHGRKSDSL